MLSMKALVHAMTFPATVAAFDVGLLTVYALVMAPVTLLALIVAAAWFFLNDTGERRRRYR